jgi:hypothetical protein
LQIVVDEIFVTLNWSPLEVIHIHLLTGAVVHSSEHVDMVVEVHPTVQEPCKRHLLQLDELHRFHVQYHGILRACAVVMSS